MFHYHTNHLLMRGIGFYHHKSKSFTDSRFYHNKNHFLMGEVNYIRFHYHRMTGAT